VNAQFVAILNENANLPDFLFVVDEVRGAKRGTPLLDIDPLFRSLRDHYRKKPLF
jgi:hypothetical protein